MVEIDAVHRPKDFSANLSHLKITLFVFAMSMSFCVLGGAAFGLASHLVYFIHGEHHMEAPAFFCLAFISPFLLLFYCIGWLHLGLWAAFGLTAATLGAYWTAIFTSITIYRVFFHRLRRFPGPLLAKTSKLYNAYRTTRENNFRWLARLHNEYGSIVRTGKLTWVSHTLSFN